MKLSGPYLTLAGGLTVAGLLLALSINAVNHDTGTTAVGVASAVGQSAGDTTPTEAPTPKPTLKAKAKTQLIPSGTYAGPVNGRRVSIAIAVRGKTAIGYVCDGTTMETWLQGKTDGDPLTLTGKKGAKLTAQYAKGALSGTLTASGKKWTFRVKQVKAPSGLYRAASNVRQAKVVSGWIVYKGTQVGMTTDTGTGAQTPAPPIDLTSGTAIIDGIKVKPIALDGSPVE